MMTSSLVTVPWWFGSPAGHCDTGATPSAMLTIFTRSSIDTVPRPEQSPTHWALANVVAVT